MDENYHVIMLRWNLLLFLYLLIHIAFEIFKRFCFLLERIIFAVIYHRHGFATEHFDGAESRVKGHVRKDVDDRNKSAWDADGLR